MRDDDARPEFLGGLGLFLLLIAQMPGAGATIAPLGYLGAVEIFVFGAGASSARAFQAVFRDRGYLLGAARVGHRICSLYWRHLAAFLVAFAALNMIDRWIGGANIESRAAIAAFIADPGERMLHLMTLTYIPDLFAPSGAVNGFAIPPMLIVVIALIPVMLLFARAHTWLAIGVSLAVWAAVNFLPDDTFGLPADPMTERLWPLNAFAWQLLFFTGVALALGWIPMPTPDPRLLAVAAAILLAVLGAGMFASTPELFSLQDLGALRILGFFSAAYLVWSLTGKIGEAVSRGGWRHGGWIGGVLGATRRVGEQSVAVFVTSLALAPILGALIFAVGGAPKPAFWAVLLACVIGVALLMLMARVACYFLRPPWKKPRDEAGSGAPPQTKATI